MAQSKIIRFLLLLCCLPAVMCNARPQSRLISRLHSGKRQTIVAYGTSLTEGGPWLRQLQETLNSLYPGKAVVINSGKSAMCSAWGVDNLDKRVIAYNPDIVLIEFAINDAYLPHNISVDQARSNLENIISRILKSNSDCEIVLMVMNPPTGIHLKARPWIKDYYQMYRDVAKEQKLLLIDHYPQWEKILNKDPELFIQYVPDGIHPGPEGSRVVIFPRIAKSLGIKVK